jgi:hypothetical protein
MAFGTGYVMQVFRKTYGPKQSDLRQGTVEYLRMPDRSSRCDELTEDQRLAAVSRADQMLSR